MARGMPKLIQYILKNNNTNTPTKSQMIEHIKLKLKKLKEEDVKYNSQIENLNKNIEQLHISKDMMLNKISPTNLKPSFLDSTPAHIEEVQPTIHPTNNWPLAATHAQKFTIGNLQLSGDNQQTNTARTVSTNLKSEQKITSLAAIEISYTIVN